MAKTEEEPKKDEVALVRLQQETGMGLQMPDGSVIDLTGVDFGQAQVLTYLVKTVSELKKNIR